MQRLKKLMFVTVQLECVSRDVKSRMDMTIDEDHDLDKSPKY